MKSSLAPAFAAVALLLSGCSPAATSAPAPAASSSAPAASAPAAAHGKALVVYFSYPENTDLPDGADASASMSLTEDNGSLKGNTAIIADRIARRTGADVFSIHTEKKYPADYDETVQLGKDEAAQNARPALSSQPEHLDQYQTIFLGYPNWWGDMPMAVYSFLDANDLSGKTIIPFVTSGGSGLSRTVESIRSAEPQATVTDGLAVYQSDVEKAEPVVDGWLAQLGYDK